MTEEADDIQKKSVTIFGRDVAAIPCFRSSFLYGIGSGFAGGLTYFLFTSNTRWATHVGFTSFVIVTMSYWFHCRWQWSKKKFTHGQLQAVMQKQAMYEGTDYDLTDKGQVYEVKN
ncbi:cytochrome c oxidase assembly protein COX20, mitochondrial isoform X2 [Cryptotermes secundus]|uniref:cytochrome c oxidase assembly protein COX20, mitochondrial isoform X2 n=1 Tax=Cryptotermes secundus TaxID=105785 RepID=UPI000CD7B7DC|nr:cytochrome c oxidase assembly protein COX20, mitochondrial isoform X2 [Cryptotermes secundus]